MIEDDDTFRLQIRFRKSEYGDILKDLKAQGTAENESGRVRYLIRLGLELDRFGLMSGDIKSLVSGSVEKQLPAAKKATGAAPEAPKSKVETDLDSLIARGFDITKLSGFKPA